MILTKSLPILVVLMAGFIVFRISVEDNYLAAEKNINLNANITEAIQLVVATDKNETANCQTQIMIKTNHPEGYNINIQDNNKTLSLADNLNYSKLSQNDVTTVLNRKAEKCTKTINLEANKDKGQYVWSLDTQNTTSNELTITTMINF